MLTQRIIALVAAYAIALAGLVANFGGAQMAAAAAAAQPSGVICHTDVLGDPAPSADTHSGSKTCIDDCCTGCLMHTAALPPPPATAIGLTPSPGERIAPPVAAVFIASPQSKSHRSRAPPLTA